MNNDVILKVENMSKVFGRNRESINAISNISFHMRKGETIGLVGESGCGKTTMGRCIVRGIMPTSGKIHYRENKNTFVDLLTLSERKMKPYRKKLQMIFQDPYSSLNPQMTAFNIISEPLRANSKFSRSEITDRVHNMAEKTGINHKMLQRHPHAFSGGQRQRIGIARALITQPAIIVCDEPVTALDVSIQAQIINLLQDLKKEYNLSCLFISHALSVVKYVSEYILVLYNGHILESGPMEAIFKNPKHPYTETLLSATLLLNSRKKTTHSYGFPAPANRVSGCLFQKRCKYKRHECTEIRPGLQKIEQEHFSACPFSPKIQLQGIGSE